MKILTLQTNFSYILSNDTGSLRYKLEVIIWRHVVNVPKSSTTFRWILTCAIFIPRIKFNVKHCIEELLNGSFQEFMHV